jgi:hypothetical protein
MTLKKYVLLNLYNFSAFWIAVSEGRSRTTPKNAFSKPLGISAGLPDIMAEISHGFPL